MTTEYNTQRMATIRTYNSESDWVYSATTAITDGLASEIQTSGSTTLALSGGSTPYPIYQSLSNASILWEQVGLISVDERYVPTDSPEYNWAKIGDSIGDNLLDRVASVCAFEYLDSRDQALAKVESCLPDRLGVVVLGMGEDGHIASLFPGQPFGEGSRVVGTTAPESYSTQERMSLSAEYIMKSGQIILLLRGESKANTVDILMDQEYSAEQFPAMILLDHPNVQIHWLRDKK